MSSNLPLETALKVDALGFVHKSVNDQLAILRQTRGQREVGTVRVPAHLSAPDIVRITGPQPDPRACGNCGNGLLPGDTGRVCARCLANPSTDAGVESRVDARPGVLGPGE